MYGVFPEGLLDHINHNKLDNRLINLRVVSHSVNHKNTPLNRNNTSGITGVYFMTKRNKWMAGIKSNYKAINLGLFKDKFEAICARKSAEVKHKFHSNHGTRRSCND